MHSARKIVAGLHASGSREKKGNSAVAELNDVSADAMDPLLTESKAEIYDMQHVREMLRKVQLHFAAKEATNIHTDIRWEIRISS
jgi:hypothetical protein